MTRRKTEVKGGFPMAWEKAIDRDLEEGDVLEGFYRGYDDIKADNRTFRSYRIQPEGAGDSPSEWIGVAGGVLKQMIERVPEGAYVWVTYLGTMKTQNGDAKNFKLEVEEGTELRAVGTASNSGEFNMPPGA